MTTETVGFIGLGAMGLGMARNLTQAGYSVAGYDISPQQAELARAQGIDILESPEAVAAAATKCVVSVVRTAEQTREVLLGDHGVIRARKPLTTVIASTLDPTTMADLAAQLASHNVLALDATMSGGPWGADAGTLTMIVSGPEDTFAALRPLLEAVGQNIFHVGSKVGTAQAAKLAVQLAFGINMLGVFEALQVVKHHDVDEQQLMAILSVSVGGSWVVDNWPRVKPWWEHYVSGGDLDILLKDLRSVLREADAHQDSMPVAGLVFQLLRSVWTKAGSRRNR